MFSSIPLQIPSGFVSQKPKYCRGKFTEEYDLDKEDKSSFSSLSLSLSSSWLTGIRVDVPHDQFACRNVCVHQNMQRFTDVARIRMGPASECTSVISVANSRRNGDDLTFSS